MRGITPVIAIILMLLIAVAAAGGVFFYIQGFTASAEEQNSSALSAVTANTGGRIHIENIGVEENGLIVSLRNSGRNPITCTSLGFFYDNIPISTSDIHFTAGATDISAKCGDTLTASQASCPSSGVFAEGEKIRILLMDGGVALGCGNSTFNSTKSTKLKVSVPEGTSDTFLFDPIDECRCN